MLHFSAAASLKTETIYHGTIVCCGKPGFYGLRNRFYFDFERRNWSRWPAETKKIFQFHLACRTQKEIAQKIDISRNRVSEIIKKVENLILEKTDIIPDSLQIYNLWELGIYETLHFAFH